MRLSRTFTVVLVSAFVLPTLGMSVFGRNALEHARAGAASEAGRVSLEAERERLQALVEREAERIDARLALVQLDVERLAQAYGRAEAAPSSETQRALSVLHRGKDTAGLPAYGYVDPTFGAYADFGHLGPQCPWVPRRALARLATEPALRAELAAELHRTADIGPHLAQIGARNGDWLDLAWVVTTSGVTNVWPPYDYVQTIKDNPAVLDLDESTMDYVRIAAPDANPEHTSRWTDPYLDRFKGVWLTSVVHPLTVGDSFHGTAGADLLLATITQDVAEADLGLPGYPMLLGPHGEIIATTSAGIDDIPWDPAWQAGLREAMRAPEEQTWTEEREAAVQRGRLLDAPDTAWVGVASAARGPAGLAEVTLSGVPRLVAHAPVRTPGWGLVMVVPTEAVLARADTVGAVVAETARGLMGDYSLFAGITLVVSLASALLLQTITIRPLESLTRRVARLTFDDLRLEADPGEKGDEFRTLEGKIHELLSLVTSARDGERAEHARLEAILGSLEDAVLATDAGGRVLRGNKGAEQLLGVPAAALTGRPLAELVRITREIDGKELTDPVGSVLRAGRPTVFHERLLLDRGGRTTPVEVRGAPLEGALGVVLVLRDATETRRFEDQLVRAQKLETVQVLASGIAHDFNNLLAGVLGYVSLARMVIDEESEAHQRLERAENAIDRAKGLTQQLLTFAVGGAPVRDADDLRAVVSSAARLPVRGTEVELELTLPDGLWSAPVDAGQIGQVVQNLVTNAVQAMERRGRLRIEGENVEGAPGGLPEGRYVCIRVTDEGAGIPYEVQPKVFDPFFSTRPGASGLGLAVCFSIVRKHHGNIEVRSTPGVGSTFTLWLPAGNAAPGPGGAPPPPTGARVLVMDDDPDLREVTGAMLERLGHVAVGVPGGAEAIAEAAAARAAGRPFQLALLDLTVPGGMGGAEALPELRAVSPELRAIVCSGFGKDPVLADPAAWGFDGRLRKPFDLAALRQEVRRVLDLEGPPGPPA